MKIRQILELIKILLLVSEQVADVIATSSIPKQKQKEVETQIASVMSKLEFAHAQIPENPIEEN